MTYFSIFQPVLLDAVAAEPKVAIFDSSFLITVALIVISTLVIAFIKHLKKDKCIKSFKSDMITVYFNDGKNIKGRLDVENTGSELIIEYPDDEIKRSYILYKEEYINVRFFVRYHNDLDKRRTKERLRVMKKTYHPNIFRRTGRVINIFFKIINDSMMEIFTALSGRLKTANTSYATSEKYVTNVNKQAVASADTTYDPLLEKYIGNKVVCNHIHNGKTYDIRGILKDYTGQYMELLDVEVDIENLIINKADLVLPRKTNRVRHLGEDAIQMFTLPETFNLNWYKKSVKKSLNEENDKTGLKE